MVERQGCWSKEERSSIVFNVSMQHKSVHTLGDTSDVSEQEVFHIAPLIHWRRGRCHSKPAFSLFYLPPEFIVCCGQWLILRPNTSHELDLPAIFVFVRVEAVVADSKTIVCIEVCSARLRAFAVILVHRSNRYIRAIGTYVANVCKKTSNSAWEGCGFIVKAVFDN